ncbi:MAG: hypothetical protein B6I20_04550 [Bacteroidetes bacterium 4572_117]|nr:MAG: hypothetical protein B6I20_04550 [Bacteroidetes bacterium 4572_117]
MTHKEHIEQLIIEGKLEIAIKELLRRTKENGQKDLQNGLILLSARNSSNENEKNMETISNGDYNREKAKITASLLYYLEKYHPSQNIPFKDDNTEENSNKPSISEIQNNMPTIHTLTGKQKKAFKIALVSAFPIVTELNQMTNIVFDKSSPNKTPPMLTAMAILYFKMLIHRVILN